MKTLYLLLVIGLISIVSNAQSLLPELWKIKAGDDIAWAAKNFDDSNWSTIKPGVGWENAALPGYDGYAWYRITFTPASSIKADIEKYGGLVLYLGTIDDMDETFLNGKSIGITGTFPPDYSTAWNTPRRYVITPDMILWDQPNVIAVRVYDAGGGGGIYGEPVQLSPKDIQDKLVIEPVFDRTDQIVLKSAESMFKVNIQNNLDDAVTGDLMLSITSDFGKQVFKTSYPVSLKKGKKEDIKVNAGGIEPGFYKVTTLLKVGNFDKKTTFSFGYKPEEIISPTDKQPDFDAFWERTKQELAQVDPQFKMIRKDSLCTERREVYLIEMQSLGNVLIRGWYSVPAKPGKYPAIIQVPGYSGNEQPAFVDYGDDIIGFGLNIRGHGNSRDNVNPGFPGYFVHNIMDKENYIYRGAYMDCVRAVEFLFSRPEVDTTRVAVEGGSQGGALTFATAALNNTRIVACSPLVPFLSDFRDYFTIAVWPASDFNQYVSSSSIVDAESCYKTLSYVDIKNLAGMIRCPMFMAVGLLDDVCPPHTNFAAYNQVKSRKKYIVLPESGHGLPASFDEVKMKWLRTQLGLK
jgi:cephalosporin-C deacetylase